MEEPEAKGRLVPTLKLRLYAQSLYDTNPVLQQGWAPEYGGTVVWRDVPVVYREVPKTAPAA